MHPKTHARWPRLFAGIMLAAGLAGAAANGQPKTPTDIKAPDVQVAKDGTLIVPKGWTVQFDSKLTELPTDILVNPTGVIQFELPAKFPGPIKLFGLNPGLAELRFILKDGTSRVFKVLVDQDFEAKKAKLKFSFAELNELIKKAFPTASVTVSPEFTPDGGGIPLAPNGPGYIVLLSGYVTSPSDANSIYQLVNNMVPGLTDAAGNATAANTGVTNSYAGSGVTPIVGAVRAANPNIISTIQVGGVQQVQIDVVIASVDRNEIRTRGFDFGVGGKTANFNSIVSGLLLPSQGLGGIAQVSPNANIQLGIAPAQLIAALQALRTEGVTKFLAEPRIVTQTGRPATFRSGGNRRQ